MLTLLINESNPLDGLFANSTTGGVGTVPDITVADDGQAVSVQSFTRAGGIITDSFVAGDALHIGIGDGVNAPVCYVALSSASPATGTMPINTAGMVALFAATVANQLSLTLAVVRTRGAYTNTIFSAPIVIRRSAINISTAVPTPSILGTGVASALQVAINTALGFVRLDASARYPALDGSQITNLAGGSLTVGTTAITSGTTTRVLFDNAGVLGEYAISGTGSVAMTTSPSLTTPTIGDGTESAPSLSFTTDANTGVYRPSADTLGIVGGGNDVLRMTGIASATDYLEIKNGIGVGSPLHVLAEGASANIGVHLQPKGSGLFTISDGTDFNKGIRFRSSSSAASAVTLIDAVSTAGRVVTLPDATGTLALVSGDLGTPSALVGTNITGTASININGTVGATTPSTVAGTTGVFSGELNTTGSGASIYTDGANAEIYTNGADANIYTYGVNASIYTNGANGYIYTNGLGAHIYTAGQYANIYTTGANAYIESRSTFRLNGGTFVTTLSHAATADRAIAFPDAAGTLLLADGSGANLTSLNADNISSGTLAAARMANAGVHTGDATGTFPAITLNAAQTGITSVGTLTGGATGAGFTVALSTSTITGTLADARLPASVANITSMTGAALAITPSTTGTINAMNIGGTTRGTGAFTTLAANSTTTLTGRVNITPNINCLSGTLSYGDGTQFIGGYDGGADRSFFFSGVIASGSVSSLKPMLFHASNHKFYTDSGGSLGVQLTATQFSLNYTADSTNSTTGAMVLSGGLGVAKAVNIGTTLGVTGAITLNGNLNIQTVTDAQFDRLWFGGNRASKPEIVSFSANTPSQGVLFELFSVGDPANLTNYEVGRVAIGNPASAFGSVDFTLDTAKAGSGTLRGIRLRAGGVQGLYNGPTGGINIGGTTDPGANNLSVSGTASITGNTTITGNLTSNGALISTPQALTGAGAVNVTTLTTAVTTTAPAQALTLANGTNGQIKTIVHQALSGGGTWVLTPTTKTGYTTITSTAVGETCTLQFFTTIGWCILSLRGAIAA